MPTLRTESPDRLSTCAQTTALKGLRPRGVPLFPRAGAAGTSCLQEVSHTSVTYC